MDIKLVGSNMTELHKNNGVVVLFSYETPVACLIPDKGYFRTDTKFSVTTTKHINKWLDGVNAEPIAQVELERIID